MLSYLHARDHQYKGNTAYSIQLYIEYTFHHILNLYNQYTYKCRNKLP